MVKAILLDLDGLVIRPRHKYFSEKLSEDYKIPLSEIMPFFKNEYKLAAKGEVGIREVLPLYLKKWGWKKSLDDFLTYWFESEKTPDTNILEISKKLREKGLKVYLVSNNEKERANYVMKDLGLKNLFDGGYFSCNLGFTKSEPEFFQKILEDLKFKSGEIMHWDDDPKEVDAAKSVGINAKLYTSFENFKDSLSFFPKL